MSGAIEQLKRDHANMRHLLGILESELEKYQKGQVPDFDLLLSIMDYTRNYPDRCHHPNEDRIYDRLVDRVPASGTLVGNLHREHEQLSQLTRKFSELLLNVTRDAEVPRAWFETTARNYIAAVRQHMTREEDVFFPMAIRLLLPEDWHQIDTLMSRDRDPLFGGNVARQYEVLHDRIVKLAG